MDADTNLIRALGVNEVEVIGGDVKPNY